MQSGGNYSRHFIAANRENLAKGIDVFLDIDWQRCTANSSKVPSVKAFFILPPSLPELGVAWLDARTG